MKVENGGNHVGCVKWIFQKYFVSDDQVPDLIGGNMDEDIGLKPVLSGGGGTGGD